MKPTIRRSTPSNTNREQTTVITANQDQPQLPIHSSSNLGNSREPPVSVQINPSERRASVRAARRRASAGALRPLGPRRGAPRTRSGRGQHRSRNRHRRGNTATTANTTNSSGRFRGLPYRFVRPCHLQGHRRGGRRLRHNSRSATSTSRRGGSRFGLGRRGCRRAGGLRLGGVGCWSLCSGEQ